MNEKIDVRASEICEIMEGTDLDVNQVYGRLVRKMVSEGTFTYEEMGMVLSAVEEKVEILNEWYEKMGM
jgi:hypothetical protein